MDLDGERDIGAGRLERYGVSACDRPNERIYIDEKHRSIHGGADGAFDIGERDRRERRPAAVRAALEHRHVAVLDGFRAEPPKPNRSMAKTWNCSAKGSSTRRQLPMVDAPGPEPWIISNG